MPKKVDPALKDRALRMVAEHRSEYPSVTAVSKAVANLRRQGLVVAHCTVDRLMRDLGMNGVRRGKKLRTTIARRDGHRAGDLLDRDFTATAPDTRWVADFTYARTWVGFVYVAFVVDVFAQRIVGWHASTSKATDLVLTPLRSAMWDRDRHGHPLEPGTLVCHSDAGRQYTSLRYTEHLALEGIAPSIGTVGDAYDNGLMESIIGLYKTEAIATDVFHAGPLKTLVDVEYATAGWLDWWNHRRLHSSIGQIPPAEHSPSQEFVRPNFGDSFFVYPVSLPMTVKTEQM